MRLHRFGFIVAAPLALALVLAFASPSAAFVRLARQQTTPTIGPVVQAHWFDSELPLLYVINPANRDISSATALAVVQASAETWENVNTSYFAVDPVDVASGPYLPATLSFDGQNSMFFDSTAVNFPAAGIIAFVRSFVDLTDGHTLDADMVFNDRDFFSSVSSPNLTPPPPGPPAQFSVDLQSVITHEFGHSFSLDHTSIERATMVPFILSSVDQRVLDIDDRAGLSTGYPESASRPGGVTPGGVDFGATTGTISGTVVRGSDGSAIFGAHVEAIDIGNPVPEASISAISGELTLRSGAGEFQIHGLPPGSYKVRIVPLDGLHTVAADANIGGPYSGLDINFPTEFWNSANESGSGLSDPASDFTAVAAAAGADFGGVGFITNDSKGLVEIAQYGALDNFVSARATAGFRGVRFDPPFDAPYTIRKISFPSFTFGGAAAVFPSVRLVKMNPATGLPDMVAPPIFMQAPFTGSGCCVNDVPINHLVTTPGETYFWLIGMPARPVTLPTSPFTHIDLTPLDRGLFGNSYDLNTAGVGGIFIDRNTVASMTCEMGTVDGAPIQAPSNLGANRRDTKVEFSFDAPPPIRADGEPMAANSLDRVDLIRRTPTYAVEGSAGAGSGSVSLTTIPSGVQFWAAQAVDKAGRKSIQTNVTLTGLNEDADEPNGRLNEAFVLAPPETNRQETYSPAGDQDYFSVMAKVGEVITASATATGLDGFNNLDLVMFLLDQDGDILAASDDVVGLNPAITLTVPPPAGPGSAHGQPRQFALWVTDFQHSLFDAKNMAPRVVSPQTYTLSVAVTTAVTSAAKFGMESGEDRFLFRNSGPNPANPQAKLLYVIPRDLGSQPVRLRIYDVSGRLVRTLIDGPQEAGPHTAIWDGTDGAGRGVASGNYFARLQAGKLNQNTTITILK